MIRFAGHSWRAMRLGLALLAMALVASSPARGTVDAQVIRQEGACRLLSAGEVAGVVGQPVARFGTLHTPAFDGFADEELCLFTFGPAPSDEDAPYVAVHYWPGVLGTPAGQARLGVEQRGVAVGTAEPEPGLGDVAYWSHILPLMLVGHGDDLFSVDTDGSLFPDEAAARAAMRELARLVLARLP